MKFSKITAILMASSLSLFNNLKSEAVNIIFKHAFTGQAEIVNIVDENSSILEAFNKTSGFDHKTQFRFVHKGLILCSAFSLRHFQIKEGDVIFLAVPSAPAVPPPRQVLVPLSPYEKIIRREVITEKFSDKKSRILKFDNQEIKTKNAIFEEEIKVPILTILQQGGISAPEVMRNGIEITPEIVEMVDGILKDYSNSTGEVSKKVAPGTSHKNFCDLVRYVVDKVFESVILRK